MSTPNWFKLILLALLWGGSYIFVEIALEGFRPMTLVFIRVALAAALLWGVALLQGHRAPRSWQKWWRFAVMGLLANVLPFTLISWAQLTINAGTASILNAAVPIFTVVLAHRFSDERLTTNKLVGASIGFAGVCILFVGSTGGDLFEPNLGMFAALLAAACYGCGAVYGTRLTGTAPIVNAAAMLSCSAAVLLPAIFVFETPFSQTPQPSSWFGVIALAVFSSAIAYLLYFGILRSSGATRLSLVTFLIPIVSILLGTAFLDERLQPNDVIGLVVILAGVAVVNRSPRLRKSRGSIVEATNAQT